MTLSSHPARTNENRNVVGNGLKKPDDKLLTTPISETTKPTKNDILQIQYFTAMCDQNATKKPRLYNW